MSRYIDADKLEGELFRDGIAGIFLDYPRRRKYTIGEIRGMLKNERIAPTADVVEVRHGCWITRNVRGLEIEVKCSVCGSRTFYPTDYKNIRYPDFCSDCGAKMDGERSKE